MDSIESHTKAPRSGLPSNPHRARTVVWVMATGLAAVFAVGQLITVLAAAPAAIAYYEGVTAPAFVAFADSLGFFWFATSLVMTDVLMFVACIALARRYWIGFAYVPPVLYLGLGAVQLWLLVSDAMLKTLGAGA